MLRRQLSNSSFQDTNEEHILEWMAGLMDRSRQGNSIKMLYQCGVWHPDLIAPYWQDFLALLRHKNNRLQWGAMMALSTIVELQHEHLFHALPQILAAAKRGTVITKDHAVNILLQLCSYPQYRVQIFPLLYEQILTSPPNQFPTYAEQAVKFVSTETRDLFLNTLCQRLPEMTTESKQKRVERLIRKLGKWA